MKNKYYLLVALLVVMVFASCNKQQIREPKITETLVEPAGTSAVFRGTVNFMGTKYMKVNVGKKADLTDAVCYEMEPEGDYDFVIMVGDLDETTTYYYRMETGNNNFSLFSNIASFETKAFSTVTTMEVVTFSSRHAIGKGKVVSDGGFEVTERGFCWGMSPNPTINDSISTNGKGKGTYYVAMVELQPNTTYYVRAYAINSGGTSYGDEMSFTTYSRPVGAIDAKFSTSATSSVMFSQGNLQYKKYDWRFAENQWDYMGEINSYIAYPYFGNWMDLFGWGTSSYPHGAECYNPLSVSENNEDYYAYGHITYNLYDSTGTADWGYNKIINGGNILFQWRTPTADEWNYILEKRETPTGIRYAKAVVNEVKGLVLLPDQWYECCYELNDCNMARADFESNVITAEDWYRMECCGAVFLPAAGYRKAGTNLSGLGNSGSYWSSSFYKYNDYSADCLEFNKTITSCLFSNLYEGCSVRVVRDVE